MKQINLIKLSTFLFILFGSTSVAFAQKVKIKKEVILLDKTPIYQIKEGEKLDRFESYTFMDMQGNEVVTAVPKYFQFERLPQEEVRAYRIPYYEVRLSDGTMISEVEFVHFGYRKRLVEFLINQGILGETSVGAKLKDAAAEMAFTPEERQKMESYNAKRKALVKTERYKSYAAQWLVPRNTSVDYSMDGMELKVGTTAVAYVKLIKADFGSNFYRYDIITRKPGFPTNSGSPIIAQITYHKSKKEYSVFCVYDKSEFTYKIEDYFSEKQFKPIGYQLFLQGLL